MRRSGKVRRRSTYSGRKYRRYRKGYWTRYRKERKQRYWRVMANMRARLRERPDPYVVKERGTPGRPPIPPKDVLVCVLMKVLFDLSYIETESFLLWLIGEGNFLMERVPGSSTMQEHMEDIPLSYLEAMMRECIHVLENCDVTLLMDATGISTRQYGRWRTSRLSSKSTKRKFVKVHLSMDLDRNIVLVGMSTKGWKGDHRFGLRMLHRIRGELERSDIDLDKVLADCGYTSREMASLVARMNGRPFLKTRVHHSTRRKGSKEWSLMVRFQREMPEEFMKFYCYRVVIEGIISAMKSIFGLVIRSRKRHNQDVEVLSRLVLWNYMNIEPEEF